VKSVIVANYDKIDSENLQILNITAAFLEAPQMNLTNVKPLDCCRENFFIVLFIYYYLIANANIVYFQFHNLVDSA
jgi:hypothetical protein